MNLYRRLKELQDARLTRAISQAIVDVFVKEGKCPFCCTAGSLEREADYCYHDRTRLDVSIGYMHVEYGSLYCRFCQRELPGTHVDSVTFAEKPKQQAVVFHNVIA